ncbi:hypothetical protein A33Q_3072 [Indibacter alkaliphilus LW1]|uniref:Uncharacterized protein n=1 Tax=Indibacter alkaliphilus (strain CCUG 57479 / KCTC 22604 / LW1) TaxID=1189612 RepID=S2DF86_INDAL|nr:hypothetical protein A33Q_3072 [Indibacter alkaliphilus LW1]
MKICFSILVDNIIYKWFDRADRIYGFISWRNFREFYGRFGG